MSITIALVDDQILFRKGLKELLTSFGGIEVQIEAANGSELISKLSGKKSIPDICIMSSLACLWNNNWTAREIRYDFNKMKILVIAPSIHLYTIQNLLRAKVNGFLTKNAKPEELKKAVFAIHKNGTYWPKFPEKISIALDRIKYSTRKIPESHLEFLKLCLEDLMYSEMGEKMGVSERTVEGYRDFLFARFKVNSRPSLVLFAIKNGLIELK